MNDENKNLPFGNNINEHDAASTRILFVNPNGLYFYTYAHRLYKYWTTVSITTSIFYYSLKQIHAGRIKERLTYSVKTSPKI